MSDANDDVKESQPSTSSTSVQWSQPCRRFEFPEIQSATDDFDESLVIGRGGFGKVYIGTILDGSTPVVAAIKRLDSSSSQGAPEFWAEVEMLSKFRHSHLVSMFGYCHHGKEMILIYEYMPNGTLEDHLHNFGTFLSWLLRLKICIGAARGLHYLHTGMGIDFVIHRDVKSSNILLDERCEAKISDFGLSRVGLANQPSTYVNTNIKGTFGYLDPDYAFTGRLTRKSDVYAFGVVLLEVLCRRRALDRSLDEDQCNLARWALESIKGGNLKHVIDEDIRDEISPKCLKEFVRIAERCLHSYPNQRPTMAQVLVSLESVLTSQEKTNSSLQAAGRTIFGKMAGRKNGIGPAIFSQLIRAKELAFLEKDYRVASLQKIGKGGFGHVYKAELLEGKVKTIAIKKIIESTKDATELFKEDTRLLSAKMIQIKSEIQTAGQIKHRNILPLLAYVSRPNCQYLVYEFMKNGSLQDIIQQVREGRRELDWLARHRIALGVAAGLENLHLIQTPRIVHGHLKPSNILLDDDMEAHITDFGLAMLIPDAYTHITCSNVAGTIGYIAPEYLLTMKLTEKCDIYSLGVLLAVLLTGKFPLDDFFQHTSEMSLVKWMRNIMISKDPKQAIDPKMMGNGYEENILIDLKIACFCTLDNPKERPNSKDLRLMLEMNNPRN